MLTFKCKMCGGDIPAEEGAAFGTCDSCGTTSTLPKANSDKIVNLFNRANQFRRLNEFDKALSAYENILNEDSENAEAHWGVVLCRYGIEYVEDPRTRERVPTCHRVQYQPILKDSDYLSTLQFSPDSYTKSLYEQAAAAISEVQRGILAISQNEQPFDVFICYKETTDGGSRTKDSTLAQDIYYSLTNEGFRVFFAKITLEDKLGREYEPYIFAALNSAKVMLVLGTKREYFEAVWVKNEWSRFLAIAKNDRNRLLIPCYRDMDAYDIPDELSHLQSQDMAKIGFAQDLLRGIKKILNVGKEEQPTATVVQGVSGNIENLLKRGRLFLEDESWIQAHEYFNKALDVDPECAEAYIGILCADEKIANENNLPFSKHGTEEYIYQKIHGMLPLEEGALEGVSMIKPLRDITGFGFKEAKDFVESNKLPEDFPIPNKRPVILKGNSYYEKAIKFADAPYKTKLEEYNKILTNYLAEEKERWQLYFAEREEQQQLREKEYTYNKLLNHRKELTEIFDNIDYHVNRNSFGFFERSISELKTNAKAFASLDFKDSLEQAKKNDELAVLYEAKLPQIRADKNLYETKQQAEWHREDRNERIENFGSNALLYTGSLVIFIIPIIITVGNYSDFVAPLFVGIAVSATLIGISAVAGIVLNAILTFIGIFTGGALKSKTIAVITRYILAILSIVMGGF